MAPPNTPSPTGADSLFLDPQPVSPEPHQLPDRNNHRNHHATTTTRITQTDRFRKRIQQLQQVNDSQENIDRTHLTSQQLQQRPAANDTTTLPEELQPIRPFNIAKEGDLFKSVNHWKFSAFWSKIFELLDSGRYKGHRTRVNVLFPQLKQDMHWTEDMASWRYAQRRTYEESRHVHWPEEFLPSEFPFARILAMDYPAPIFSRHNPRHFRPYRPKPYSFLEWRLKQIEDLKEGKGSFRCGGAGSDNDSSELSDYEDTLKRIHSPPAPPPVDFSIVQNATYIDSLMTEFGDPTDLYNRSAVLGKRIREQGQMFRDYYIYQNSSFWTEDRTSTSSSSRTGDHYQGDVYNNYHNRTLQIINNFKFVDVRNANHTQVFVGLNTNTIHRPEKKDILYNSGIYRKYLRFDRSTGRYTIGDYDLSIVNLTEMTLKRIRQASIGDHGKRPVILVTHNIGGLVAKNLYVEDETFRRSVKGIVFYGCPHFGTPLARIPDEWQYLFSRLVREISTAEQQRLLDLHNKFMDLANREGLKVLSLVEGRSTKLPFNIWEKLVPLESCDINYGDLFMLNNATHEDLAKVSIVPALDFRYRLLISFIHEVLEAFPPPPPRTTLPSISSGPVVCADAPSGPECWQAARRHLRTNFRWPRSVRLGI